MIPQLQTAYYNLLFFLNQDKYRSSFQITRLFFTIYLFYTTE